MCQTTVTNTIRMAFIVSLVVKCLCFVLFYMYLLLSFMYFKDPSRDDQISFGYKCCGIWYWFMLLYILVPIQIT